uniref:Uncharacterized protein n=1 Tax=Zea mays TaxID=4577 RepID=C0PLF1_MAIZE|nr:unknown [Zea mays]
MARLTRSSLSNRTVSEARRLRPAQHSQDDAPVHLHHGCCSKSCHRRSDHPGLCCSSSAGSIQIRSSTRQHRHDHSGIHHGHSGTRHLGHHVLHDH